MGKTRAEYQKDYRESKKKADSEFLTREKNRVKSYRIPIDQLPPKKKKTVRKHNRQYSRIYRAKKKQEVNENKEKAYSVEIEIAYQSAMVSSTTMPVQDDAIASTSHDDNQQGLPSRLRRNGPLLVKMIFPNRKRKTKRSKVLKQANERIKELSKKVTHLTERQAVWKKRYQRVSKTTQRKTNQEVHQNTVY